MKCKFEFRPITKTYSDPVVSTFRPGTPFGREYSRGDIVLLHPEISASKTYLNSKVLRDAILNSKEYLEEVLGLVITDALEPKKTESKKEKKDKKEVKEEKLELVEEPVTDITPDIPENKEEVTEELPEKE
jgi:hypothetical protein